MNAEILDQHLSNSQLTITPEIKSFLKETAKWAKLLSIVGFFFVALIAIIGIGISIFSGSVLSGLDEVSSELVPKGMFGAVGFMYVVLAIVYLVPINYMYKFSSKMNIALATDDQNHLSESFRNLKSLYKFFGIFMAIIIGMYALIFAIAIVAGLVSSF